MSHSVGLIVIRDVEIHTIVVCHSTLCKYAYSHMAPRTKSNGKSNMKTDPEDAMQGIHESIACIFEQVQLSVANHRKNCVALWKVYAKVCDVVDVRREGSSRGGVKYVGERRFGEVFLDMVRRVLGLKKGAGASGAERVVRFVGEFVKFVTERGPFPFSFGIG